jgi:hypothetical protein
MKTATQQLSTPRKKYALAMKAVILVLTAFSGSVSGPAPAFAITIDFENEPSLLPQPNNFAAAGPVRTYSKPGVYSITGGGRRSPDHPCSDDQVATRTPLTRMPRKVGWLKPSRKFSISASLIAWAAWSMSIIMALRKVATAPATASRRWNVSRRRAVAEAHSQCRADGRS